MKIRTGFVANSSTSSFILRMYEMPKDMRDAAVKLVELIVRRYEDSEASDMLEVMIDGTFSCDFELGYEKGLFECYVGYCDHYDVPRLEQLFTKILGGGALAYCSSACEAMVAHPGAELASWMITNTPEAVLKRWIISKDTPDAIRMVAQNILAERKEKQDGRKQTKKAKG